MYGLSFHYILHTLTLQIVEGLLKEIVTLRSPSFSDFFTSFQRMATFFPEQLLALAELGHRSKT
jgi:hypothetical protein